MPPPDLDSGQKNQSLGENQIVSAAHKSGGGEFLGTVKCFQDDTSRLSPHGQSCNLLDATNFLLRSPVVPLRIYHATTVEIFCVQAQNSGQSGSKPRFLQVFLQVRMNMAIKKGGCQKYNTAVHKIITIAKMCFQMSSFSSRIRLD